MRLHWNGCGLMLHELSHLIHQLVLPLGLENLVVKKAFERARIVGLYESVRRRDWAGRERDFDLAYAMVDFKEFFAEMSVTYWSRGYEELGQSNKSRMLQCSPPFMEPGVIARVRERLSPEEQRDLRVIDANESRPNTFNARFFCFNGSSPSPCLIHCNKFYPFTSGQLKYHDPSTFCVIEKLWKEVAEWADPQIPSCCGNGHGCWNSPVQTRTTYDASSSPAMIEDTVDL